MILGLLRMLVAQTGFDGIDAWGSGEWEDAIFGDIVALIGEGAFAVLIGATLIVSFWLGGDRDLAAPSIATVLLGALMFPLLPANFVGIAWAVVFIGITGAFFAVMRRYVL
jgi:Na+-transporting NADH:ubiquinone oxidoreductase subunit NqrB